MALLVEKDQELEKLRGSAAFSHGLAAQRGRSSSDEKAAADSRAPAGGGGYSADSAKIGRASCRERVSSPV